MPKYLVVRKYNYTEEIEVEASNRAEALEYAEKYSEDFIRNNDDIMEDENIMKVSE